MTKILGKKNDTLPLARSGLSTWHIHLKGQVQGVGFRPFVFLLAKKHGLHGWVNNTSDGVHIEINSDKKKAILFFGEIIRNAT